MFLESSMTDQIYSEIKRIPRLSDAGAALVRYAIAISGSEPKWETEQWVFRPDNFVTFRIQHARDRSIKISLRGHPEEFLSLDGVQLTDNMGNGAYSTCKLTDNAQLAAIALHIRTAHDNYVRGSQRHRRKPQLTT